MNGISVRIIAAWLFAGMFHAAGFAAELKNGIYPIVPDGQGTRASRTSGGAVDLGERASDNFGNAMIWSMSNQNDRFRVLMKDAGPFNSRGHFCIYVDGVCEGISSYSEPDATGKLELITDIVGHENATKVAARLNTKLQLRKHPGHQLRVSWKSVQDKYKVSEPVIAELEILNVGTTTVRFMEGGQQRGSRDNQFGFTAFAGSGYGKALPDTGDPTNHGGIAGFRTLAPEESFHKQVDLTRWFKFEKPDTYEITGMYELELRERDALIPVAWDEFATGRCLVRIEK